MFVISYLKQIVLILTIGMGIGFLVPVVMLHMPVSKTQGSNKNVEFSDIQAGEDLKTKTQNANQLLIPTDKYYARIDEGILFVVHGNPQSPNFILTGIDIKNWPKSMQDLITQREYNSLDEVQSFIDSMSEELRLQ